MLLKAPYHYLYGSILVIAFMGAFAATTSMFSVYLVLFFGLAGIAMDFFGLPMTPLMLAFILGGKLESYFRMGVSYGKGDYSLFFTRPLSLIFIIITIYSLFGPAIRKLLKERRGDSAVQEKMGG